MLTECTDGGAGVFHRVVSGRPAVHPAEPVGMGGAAQQAQARAGDGPNAAPAQSALLPQMGTHQMGVPPG
jgi:hypothetical protein